MRRPITQDALDTRALNLALDLLELLRERLEGEFGTFEFLIGSAALLHVANLVNSAAKTELGPDVFAEFVSELERYRRHVNEDFDVVTVAGRKPGESLAARLPRPKPGPAS